MNDPLKWLEGKKTYIVAVIGALLAVAAAFGIVIPEWVLMLLGALGLTTVRAGIASTENKINKLTRDNE